MIVIVDYDTGNTYSLSQALTKIGLENKITAEPADILKAEGIILPGVGAFPQAMANLAERNLIPAILAAVAKGTPLLGVCLGMQLLFESSLEYGETAGLSLIPGQVLPFPPDLALVIPHMGWNQLEVVQEDPFVADLQAEYVYYVHSYYVNCEAAYILATSDYGVTVPGIVRKGNIFGAQFHPEKSGEVGLNLLKAFKKAVLA